MKEQEYKTPTVDQIEAELQHTRYRRRYGAVLRSTVFMLIVVAAAAVLVATLWLPVLQIYGSSMTPTLEDGDIAVSVKFGDLEYGDILVFYYNNKILIKRVIGLPGDWINIDEDGTVYVNGEELDEPYISEKSLGECDIELPYQVPESRVFVMGDHRSTSVDSRSSTVGCIADDQIVGKLIFRVWPLSSAGVLK